MKQSLLHRNRNILKDFKTGCGQVNICKEKKDYYKSLIETLNIVTLKLNYQFRYLKGVVPKKINKEKKILEYIIDETLI